MAKSNVVPIVLGVAALGAGLALAAGASGADGETVKEKAGNPPADVLGRIVAALATNDPAKMRAEATKLEAEGWRMQATELRRAADAAAVAAGILNPKANSASGLASPSRTTSAIGDDYFRAPARPRAGSPLPGVVPAAIEGPTADPVERLAHRMVLNLLQSDRGAEDRELVRRFQAEHRGLKATGLYGPGTALVLAQEYGIVPPRPFFWPSGDRVRVKRRYRETLALMARKDPQRADEWTAAAMVK